MSQNAESTRVQWPYNSGRAGWINLDGIPVRIDLEARTEGRNS